jgi:hypothetical protein
MEAIRHIITSNSKILSIPLPLEYQKKKLEVIIMPAHIKLKNKKKLADAHKIIDLGGNIKDIDKFLSDFEESIKDNNLPFRQ